MVEGPCIHRNLEVVHVSTHDNHRGGIMVTSHKIFCEDCKRYLSVEELLVNLSRRIR